MLRIRPLVIGVFQHRGRILVARGNDDIKRENFYRPLGGEIEFGELAEEALRREIREEVGLEVTETIRLGVLENRFEYQGTPAHEIVFVYDARFVDERVYAQSEIAISEPVWDGPAIWLDLERAPSLPLYPDGLLTLLCS